MVVYNSRYSIRYISLNYSIYNNEAMKDDYLWSNLKLPARLKLEMKNYVNNISSNVLFSQVYKIYIAIILKHPQRIILNQLMTKK